MKHYIIEISICTWMENMVTVRRDDVERNYKNVSNASYRRLSSLTYRTNLVQVGVIFHSRRLGAAIYLNAVGR